MAKKEFINRDLSWLSFNQRVLEEAASENVPILERIKFLSIFSSNLDEFYRVRMPALMALQKIRKKKGGMFDKLNALVYQQQKRFGYILDDMLIPLLKRENIHFINAEQIPPDLDQQVTDVFFSEVAGLLQPVYLDEASSFFPENNQLYILVIFKKEKNEEKLAIVNIPIQVLPRFFTLQNNGSKFIIFLDDIIGNNLGALFPGKKIKSSFNFKITRDAELNLTDDFDDDVASKIEKQLLKRDSGLATRFLYQPGIPNRHLLTVFEKFNLNESSGVKGGVHHGLKDLFSFPLTDAKFLYPSWPSIKVNIKRKTLLDEVSRNDLMVHTPYNNYQVVLRFFNEAAMDERVQEIYTTLYRIASDSRIAQSLISAAHNGKKVTVLVELKARFDEANNLRWSKRMKEAGVKIIYSSHDIKVHAKIALIVRSDKKKPYIGLLATGNLNENTARAYTDHILLTAHSAMLGELKMLFDFLLKKQKPDQGDHLYFDHLLVAQFNLHQKFMDLIDREISNARKGKKAAIILKLNNLEEEKLISNLYKASSAGVKIDLIVRGICCLRPGVAGLSENIRVKRIVDRYLEHGRVFIFHNGGNLEIFLGSADWMIRNIYRRIEVCFPIYHEPIRKQMLDIIDLQLSDNVQAVWIDENGQNLPISKEGYEVRSQEAIYQYLLG